MNIIPTLEGGLRIEVEDAADWFLLLSIGQDAHGHANELAHLLTQRITHDEIRTDWQHFVTPDLEAAFLDAVQSVTQEIQRAHASHHGAAGVLWITPNHAEPWYSTLNQARLALESRYHFGPSCDPTHLSPTARGAFLRSQLYCAIQSLLLEHVLH